MSISREALLKLIAENKARLANAPVPILPAPVPVTPEEKNLEGQEGVNPDRVDATASSDSFSWNLEQLEGISLARKGKSFCLIGAAGTGKTTLEKEICRLLVADDIIPPLDMDTKYLQRGRPGILITSFTRRAVRNSRRVLPDDVKDHCVTLHKVLEFEPVFFEVWDEEKGEMRKTMRFEPQRNRNNPLPNSLRCIIIDESSMVSTELFKQLLDAIPDVSRVQFIFVGDLHQLPPVYGTAILGFKLLELPTVELTKIYRQAQKSPIITLAHKIKNGEDVPVTEKYTIETDQGKVTIHPFKKPFSDFDATRITSVFLKQLIEKPEVMKELYGITEPYDPEEDIILCPQEKTKNRAYGTNEFNRIIAQSLGEKRSAVVFEIIAGFSKHYLAVGDRILVGREDAVITKISKNGKYWGPRARPASVELDRWGSYKKKVQDEEGEDFDVDKYLESFDLTSQDSNEERKQEASHLVDVELLDSGLPETLSTAAEFNAAQFAYALTVHKSQGSEWNRVFFLTHQSHVVMWSRELVYTAITRARKEFYTILEPDRNGKLGTLSKAARSPRIKGDTLAEKAEYFKGKKEDWDKQVEELDKLPKGIARPGTYQGQKEPEKKPVIPVSTKPPLQIVRFAELVSAAFKKQANAKLDNLWMRAEIIWGKDKIGDKPTIDYNLQSSRVIGLASYADKMIKLNAVWCVVADHHKGIWEQMIDDTIPHEVAHFINQRYSTPKGKGHDGGWVMAAKLLGMTNPQEKASEGEFPAWATGYREAMKIILETKVKETLEKEGKEFSKDDDFVNLYDSNNVEA